MRKLFLHIIMSLDGFIEDRDKQLDWQLDDAEFESYINGVLRSIDGMVFGRKAFELLAGYWPTAAANPSAAADPSSPERHIEAAHMMNALPKYVVSNTLKTTEWNNSHIISGDVKAEITKLKQQPGKDIALFAGANVATSFTKLGLVDEFRIIVNPVLLGDGTPLFQGGYDKLGLELVETRKFQAGAMLLTYRPKG